MILKILILMQVVTLELVYTFGRKKFNIDNNLYE